MEANVPFDLSLLKDLSEIISKLNEQTELYLENVDFYKTSPVEQNLISFLKESDSLYKTIKNNYMNLDQVTTKIKHKISQDIMKNNSFLTTKSQESKIIVINESEVNSSEKILTCNIFVGDEEIWVDQETYLYSNLEEKENILNSLQKKHTVQSKDIFLIN